MLRLLAFVALLIAAPAGSAATWAIEPETRIDIDVPWRGGTVVVRFPGLSGSVDFDEAHPESARAVISVPVAEATTGLAPVDLMIRSPDYLDAARNPVITFRLDRLVPTSRQTADVFGRITLRGITRPLDLEARVFRYGPAEDDPERFVAGFDLTGEIDRTAFGSTAGVPEIPAVLPLRIRLVMSSL